MGRTCRRSSYVDVVEPGGLLAQLADDEGLQEVTQLGHARGILRREFAGIRRIDSRVQDVDSLAR
ncbi:MAG TPA: hypothetical protein VIJ11_03480 [Galbitalea sp.]|jgi:hypothetical protein